jgi:hypothetical protein
MPKPQKKTLGKMPKPLKAMQLWKFGALCGSVVRIGGFYAENGLPNLAANAYPLCG